MKFAHIRISEYFTAKLFYLPARANFAEKRCVNVGKNSKKYTRKLLDQLEFDYLFLYMTNSGFSPFSSYEHIRRKSIFATIPKHMPKSLSS